MWLRMETTQKAQREGKNEKKSPAGKKVALFDI